MLVTTTESATEGLFKVAQRTPFNISPERKQELVSEVFKGEDWTISRQGGKANFSAVVEDRELILRHSGLASLWSMSYAAFHIMDLASRKQRESSKNQGERIDFSKEFNALGIPEYIAYSENLFSGDKPWPTNLDQPNVSADLSSIEGKINNVFFGALSWILLHEIGHVHHNDSLVASSHVRIQQEFNADEFATKWVLDNAGNGIQREFRVLMITVGLAWLFLLESNRGQGTTHPPTIFRFREAAKCFELSDRSAGLENSAYVLKAILDPDTLQPYFDTPKESFEWMASRLEELFPYRR